MKFRKKPVIIDAVQFTDNFLEIENFVGEKYNWKEGRNEIITLEGNMQVSNGDWIIKGVNGEFYPCKPDIFEKTYEPVQ